MKTKINQIQMLNLVAYLAAADKYRRLIHQRHWFRFV